MQANKTVKRQNVFFGDWSEKMIVFLHTPGIKLKLIYIDTWF